MSLSVNTGTSKTDDAGPSSSTVPNMALTPAQSLPRPEIFCIRLVDESENGGKTPTPASVADKNPNVVVQKPANNGKSLVYYPDSTIHGRLYIKTAQSVRLRTLKISLHGVEYVRFVQTGPRSRSASATSGGSPRKRDKSAGKKPGSRRATGATGSGAGTGKTFSQNAIIMDAEVTLLSAPQNLQSLDAYPELPAGSHCYAFSFQLPHANLPASFEGEYGCIR